MRIQIGFAGGLAMGWLLLGLAAPALAADGTVDVCLKSGILIRATKVEIKGGNLAIETEKGASVKIPNDTVASIGVPCPAAATSPAPAPAATAPATTSAAITQAVAAVPMPAATGRFGIAGSNTIGERLMPMLIDAFAKAKLGKPAKFTPAGQEQQQVQLFQGTASAPVVTIDLKAQGSATAYPALLDATALIGMSSRPAKAEEAASVSQKFNVDLLAAGSAHVLGLDGLAVIVNPANPIRSLDLTTIARIFSGQITDWSVVGGFDANGNPVTGPKLPIALHARDDKSGTFDTFKNLVLGKLDPAQPLSPKASRYESSESLSAAVTKDAGAIGFIGLPYINQNHALGISSDCGLVSEPSRFAVKTEEYALTRRLFLYTIGAPREPMAQHLIDFALSDEAQKTVSDAEFIDQSVEFADPAEQKQWADGLIKDPAGALPQGKTVPPRALKTFRSLMDETRRSSIVFRFEKGKADLDIRAQQDIGRLANYVASQSVPSANVYVVGFADADGDWAANQHLSQSRAERVAAELGKLGLKIVRKNIIPLSYLAPVTCNDTGSPASAAAAKAKNRRVEVWVQK